MADPKYHPYYAGSRALVIGINDYSDPRLVPLGQAEGDAHTFAEALTAPPYEFTVTTLLGQEATRQAILKALFSLRSSGDDDRVLVYFAGHGYTLIDRFNHEQGYLAAVDTVPEQDFTALALDEITDLRRHAAAKHIAFIFDACFSGQALGLTRAPAVAAEKFLERRAYQIISAGAGDQTVSDARSMTRLLLEGLHNRASGDQGLYTLTKLGLFVQAQMTTDSGQMQIPQFGHLQGSQGGDFVLWMDTRPRLPRGMETALGSSLTNIRLGVVAELIELAGDPNKAELAHERLAALAQSDPEKRVRDAAQAFFDPPKAPEPTPASQPEPIPALHQEPLAPPDISPDQAAVERSDKMQKALASQYDLERRRVEGERAQVVASQKASDQSFMEKQRKAMLAEEATRQSEIRDQIEAAKRQQAKTIRLLGVVILVLGIIVVIAFGLVLPAIRGSEPPGGPPRNSACGVSAECSYQALSQINIIQ